MISAALGTEFQLSDRIFTDFFFISHIYDHFHQLAQYADTLYLTFQSIRSRHAVTHIRQTAVQVFVSFFFIFQTTHQSAAYTGNLGRIQGQILFLCHLDGHRCELGQKCMTAQRSSADTDTAQNLGLIPDTDLTQFDSSTEHTCQIFYQFTEIDSSVCGKIKQQFIVVKRILCLYQFHRKTMFFDLFQANFICFFLFFMISLFNAVILRCCHTDHRLQRLNHLIVCNAFRWYNDCTIFNTAGCLHDDMAAPLQFQVFRVKVVHLSRLTESDSSYFYHPMFSLIVIASNSMVRSKFTFARIRRSAVSIASKICCRPW